MKRAAIERELNRLIDEGRAERARRKVARVLDAWDALNGAIYERFMAMQRRYATALPEPECKHYAAEATDVATSEWRLR